MKKTILKILTISLAAVFAVFFASCPEEEKKEYSIDPSLYGTWKDDKGGNILTITFSSSDITWGGTSGSAYNYNDAVWTAKNGAIKYTLSGNTTTVWTYAINGSGQLVLTSPNDSSTHTLVKEGSSIGGTWTPDGYSPIQLTENQWADGNISTDDGQQWFTFTATSVQYIRITFGTLTDLYVQVYNSSGSTVGSSSSLYGSTTSTTKDYQSLISGQKYFIKVWPFSENSGTYQITFTTLGTSGNFVYDSTDTTVTIVDYTGNGGAVEIPSTINGKSVTAIGECAFCDRQFPHTGKGLTSVTIPDSVTTIGYYAFYDNQLTSVTIPASVTTIGYYAFSYNQLTSVTIPASVATIEDGTFSYNQLTSVTIPVSVTTIERYAFFYNQLDSVTIPDSVTTIGNLAFSRNPLTSITVNSGNTAYITKDSFLLSIDEKELLLYFGSGEDVVIPNGITTIERYAFYGNQLTSVTIPDSVTAIMACAFTNSQLTSVNIGANVSIISTGSAPNEDKYNNKTQLVNTFPVGFIDIYYNNSCEAGIYTRPDANSWDWTKVD